MITLEAARNDPRWEPREFVKTRLGTVHVAVEGAGPDVILIHGVTDNSGTWRAIQRALPDARTHAIDLPGHGLSDIPQRPTSTRELGEWVGAYLESANVERAVVAGWSLGGATTLELAAAYPARVSALVLVAAAALTFRMAPGLLMLKRQFVGSLLPRLGGSERMRRMLLADTYGRGFRPTPDVLERYFRGWQIEGRARVIGELLSTLELAHLAGVVPRIEAPAWVVHGEQDRLVPVRIGHELAERLPRAESRILPGVGHAAHIERPDVVVEAIRKALAVEA